MRTVPDLPRRPRSTLRLLLDLLMAILLFVAVVLLTGCQLTITPDGSKSVTLDGPSLIQILAEK
jgi:hypothetical protein